MLGEHQQQQHQCPSSITKLRHFSVTPLVRSSVLSFRVCSTDIKRQFSLSIPLFPGAKKQKISKLFRNCNLISQMQMKCHRKSCLFHCAILKMVALFFQFALSISHELRISCFCCCDALFVSLRKRRN